MCAACPCGSFAPAKVRVALRHVFVVLILPLNQLLPVADDILGTEPLVLRQGHKDHVHVGRTLIHMYNSGHDGSRMLVLLQKFQRVRVVGTDFIL